MALESSLPSSQTIWRCGFITKWLVYVPIKVVTIVPLTGLHWLPLYHWLVYTCYCCTIDWCTFVIIVPLTGIHLLLLYHWLLTVVSLIAASCWSACSSDMSCSATGSWIRSCFTSVSSYCVVTADQPTPGWGSVCLCMCCIQLIVLPWKIFCYCFCVFITKASKTTITVLLLMYRQFLSLHMNYSGTSLTWISKIRTPPYLRHLLWS